MFNVNRDWLEIGDGHVFNEMLTNSEVKFEQAKGMFRGLNADYQDYVLKPIEMLLEIQEKQKKTS